MNENKLMVQSGVNCGECGSPMELRKSPKYKSPFWGCTQFPKCRGTHGAHPDGRPLGIPANRETKDARIRAHAAFDALWKEGHMSRRKAYAWLANKLNQTEAHIGEMSIGECNRVIEYVGRRLNKKSGDLGDE